NRAEHCGTPLFAHEGPQRHRSTGTAMHRTIRLKAVLVLLCTCLTSGVAVHFVHGFQMKRNARTLLAQADDFEHEDHPEQAVDCLGMYLGLAPGDTEVHIRQALLLERLARTPRAKVEAFLALDAALRRDAGRQNPRRLEARRKAAELALAVGRLKDAEEILCDGKKPEEVLRAEEDPEVLHLLAVCAVRNGQPDRAADWFDKAVRQAEQHGDEDPDRVVQFSAEYAAARHDLLSDPEGAEEVIESLLKTRGRSVRARLAAAHYYIRAGEWNKAE